MKIAIQTWGSEGDIRPFGALAHGLCARGHDVRLVYTSVEGREYPDWHDVEQPDGSGRLVARAVGTRYFLDHRDEHARASTALLRTRSPLAQLKFITQALYDPVVGDMFEAAQELCRGSDLIVHHPLHHAAATAAAQFSRPSVAVMPVPSAPTRHVPPLGSPDAGRFLNPLLWWLAARVIDSMFLPRVNALRSREHVPRVSGVFRDGLRAPRLILVAISPTLFRRPTDWLDTIEVSGFLDFEASVLPALPDELSAFVDAGPPPLFVAFGSMLALDPAFARKSVRIVLDAVRQVDARVIVQLPDALESPSPATDQMCFIGRVAHSAILPRCAAVIHHGGAGTTHAVARAGVPSIVVPHAVDQFFWGDVLRRQGIASAPLPRRRLTPSRLARRIDQVLESAPMAARALEIGRAMRRERGVERAIELIERLQGT